MHSRNHVVSGNRIVLIDDNRNGLLLRKAILEEAGFQVTAESIFPQALRQMQQRPFELVVIACCQPDLNPRSLIEEVRGVKPNVPVILVSNFVESHGLTEASTGADSVLQKSASEAQHLVRTARRLLRRFIPRKPAGSAAPRSLNKAAGVPLK